ncbi:MAG: hypothetical protein VKJ64_05870 [Leptolyngbyaceae bacterium]|nr:hypothetical protein [Leptolyngbyaceae bacterium]
MLVILMNEQVISPQAVCQGCLMATQQGEPRWRSGKLLCGRSSNLVDVGKNHPTQYECQMGFKVADINN